jgi:hypothetical protein
MKYLSLTLMTLLCSATPSVAADADTPPYKIGQFAQEVAAAFTVDNGLPSNDVRAIHLDSKGAVWADTDKGWAVFQNDAWTNATPPNPKSLIGHVPVDRLGSIANITNQATQTQENQIIAATSKGLMISSDSGFEPYVVEDGLGRRWGTSDVRGVTVDTKGRLWFGTLAGAACKTPEGWRFYTGKEGLPYNDFTVIEAGPDGIVWFGTRLGAIRFDGQSWHYRQGRRWLPNDDVRDVAVDKSGNAWFATAGGVGLIERRMMTLAEKAQFYEDEMERYIRRTPFGYVCEVSLPAPGDKSKIIYHDSDNDGLWTAMYGAGECFAYAATKDPKAKDRAKRAFEALQFLQKVTQGGPHSPPKGYVARTIRSVDLPDPNIGRIENDRRTRERGDKLWKVYEPRWPKSADGKWYWKSDTSSDELDGHYFFYPLYYDLVAESEAEKERVREVVRDLTDHMIDHGYNLVDHDGTPTRWGYYAPESLNHDISWWGERGLKSISMLSYLAVAEHMTGDAKYRDHLNLLMNEHAYHTNAMIYKIHRGIGSGNQSDDEMAFMSYYNLIKYANDEKLRRQIMYSFFSAWINEQPEMNPFFNFAFAAFGIDFLHADQWGSRRLAPWKGWLEDAMTTLQGFPLDRLNWASQNSHRLDILPLPRQQQTVDVTDSARQRIGFRVNGKVIPVENRHFNHWNTNPWELDYGGNGQGLASGTVYLLPYYMGLYHGFIEETN